jgi:hypothetical protein
MGPQTLNIQDVGSGSGTLCHLAHWWKNAAETSLDVLAIRFLLAGARLKKEKQTRLNQKSGSTAQST